MSAQIKGVLFAEQAGDSRDNTKVCFFLSWSHFCFPQTHCRQCCQQHTYLKLVDPRAAGSEIGLCWLVLPAGWHCPRNLEAAGTPCWFRRASSLPRGWAEVSWWLLDWHCCVHCVSSSWLGIFRYLIRCFLIFQGLAATPVTGGGLFGGVGIRQWFRLENTAPSWACDEPETGGENAMIYQFILLLKWSTQWVKGFGKCCVMELGGEVCPGAHRDAGLVELLPLIVGSFGYLAGPLPVLLVMCQVLELLMSHAQLKGKTSLLLLLLSGRITSASFLASICTDLFKTPGDTIQWSEIQGTWIITDEWIHFLFFLIRGRGVRIRSWD